MSKKSPQLRFEGFTDAWEERKLSDLFIKGGSGGTPKSTNKAFYDGDIPFLGISDITKSNGFINNTEKHISSDGLNSSAAWIVSKGAISLAMYASVGKLAILNIDAATSQAFYNMIFDDYDLRDLVYQRLNKANELSEWNKLISTGTQSNLNADKVKNFQMYLSKNHDEIKLISTFFKQIDNTIALHQRKLDLLKEQKKGYLQKMFPKNGAKVPELRFAGFAEDWEERKLIDVKDNEDRYSYTGGPFGSDLKSSDYTEIGVRIIQLQNIGDGKFVNDYKIYTSEEKARSLNSNLIYPGEIIIAKMADPLARATILPKIEPKYLMASDGIRLKINTDYFDNYYILTLINSDVFRKEALNNSTGTTRKRIGLVTLGNLPMMIPSFEEQQKIGSFFKQLDDTIALHQRKLDLLKEQKKGFLQKMFV